MQVFSHFTANNTKIKEFKFPRELVLESYLIENSEVLSLDDKIYVAPVILGAELKLTGGRKNKQGDGRIDICDGRIDILASYNNEIFAIIELKLGELTEQHLKQLEDYLGQSQEVEKLIKEHLSDEQDTPTVVGILVGETINDDLAKKIKDGYVFTNDTKEKIKIAALTIKRFQNEKGQIYVWTDAYFKSNSKDMTKYKFNGTEYAKNRFILEVVKGYCESNPKISFEELRKEFPDKLQGSFKVFVTLEEANEKHNRVDGRHRYYFTKPEETIQLNNNEIIAVCTLWNTTQKDSNFNRFINHINDIPDIKKHLG